MHRPEAVKPADPSVDNPNKDRARVILDSSNIGLSDRPSLLEEQLLKTNGILGVEINAFSGKIAIEFDPSLVNLETIKRIIFRNFGHRRRASVPNCPKN